MLLRRLAACSITRSKRQPGEEIGLQNNDNKEKVKCLTHEFVAGRSRKNISEAPLRLLSIHPDVNGRGRHAFRISPLDATTAETAFAASWRPAKK
jgi:hypothetical protein